MHCSGANPSSPNRQTVAELFDGRGINWSGAAKFVASGKTNVSIADGAVGSRKSNFLAGV